MERLFQALKDIYKDADATKRHLLYASLLIIPSIAVAFTSILNKNEVVLGIGSLVFGVSCILAIILMGVWIQFCQDRFNGILGFPKLNEQLFSKGLKAIPLALVWVMYCLIAVGVPCIPLIMIYVQIFSVQVATLLGLLFLLLFLLELPYFVILWMISPFVGFLFLKYAKTEKYTADLFNPFAFVKYIRKAFKRIIMIALKLVLFAMIMCAVLSIIFYVIYFIVVFIATVFSYPATTADAGTSGFYSPVMLIITIGGASILAVIQSYASAIIGFAGVDNYIEVYKEEFDD